jgi:hypothetical protein
MNQLNKNKLTALMVKFNALSEDYTHAHFHAEWKPFIDTLSSADSKFAVQTMLQTIVESAQEFRKIAVHLIENGTDENRQTITEMVKDFKQLPIFDRNRATA